MTNWHLTGTLEDQRHERWKHLPKPAMAGLTGAEGYRTHPALIDAINVALALGQPLFVTGEPGCGKTELGNYVAWALDLGRAIRFDTKSTMTSRDLFYQVDTLDRFHAAQTGGNTDPRFFITYQALGLAILNANSKKDVADLVCERFEHTGPIRSVVLIDEIDKAPRDVPNDLLTEVENMRFFIPELDRTVAADPAMRPILVITSNSEKALPDAFLRRCVYYHIPFPADDELSEIAAARIAALPRDSDLVGDVIMLFGFVRHARQRLRKNPGTAELLGFLQALRDRGYGPDTTLRGTKDWVDIAQVTLFKTREDQTIGRVILESFDWSKPKS
jgi:MoxR-like ATPase